MNERSLSRNLSTGVVDTLKAHGHVLVVKGGALALAREIDELIAPEIAVIGPRLKPRGVLAAEPTSTFGDESVDQAVEELVAKLTGALMRSDHVEDVFAEDGVIRRDIFRAVRDGLLVAPTDGAAEDASAITVKLDLLGYVAATVSKRADPGTLQRALDRAAVAAEARLSRYVPELREATFRAEDRGSDARLDLEDAVADELTDLVEQGVVELPSEERRIDLGRALSSADRRALQQRIDAAAGATLRGAGCMASWSFGDARTLRVTFTPLSEPDARGVDALNRAFAREVAALLAASAPKPSSSPARAAEAAPADGDALAAPAPEAAAQPPLARAKRASKRASTPAPAQNGAVAKTARKRAAAPAKATKSPAKKR